MKKLINLINTKPVGPNSPYLDFFECGLLDAELLKEYQDRFGDKKRLTPEEALDFLTDMHSKFEKMLDLY